MQDISLERMKIRFAQTFASLRIKLPKEKNKLKYPSPHEPILTNSVLRKTNMTKGDFISSRFCDTQKVKVSHFKGFRENGKHITTTSKVWFVFLWQLLSCSFPRVSEFSSIQAAVISHPRKILMGPFTVHLSSTTRWEEIDIGLEQMDLGKCCNRLNSIFLEELWPTECGYLLCFFLKIHA